MTRLAIADREGVPAEAQHFYDQILWTRGQVSGPFSVLMNAPDIAARTADVGDFILYDSVVAPQVKYLVMLIAAHGMKSDYAWQSLLPHARAASVRAVLIEAIKQDATPRDMSREEQQAYTVASGLVGGNHHLREETYRDAVEFFGVKVLVQIAAAVAYVLMQCFLLNTFGVEYAPDESQLIL